MRRRTARHEEFRLCIVYLFGAVGGISLFMLVLDNVLVTRSASAVLSPTSLGAV